MAFLLTLFLQRRRRVVVGNTFEDRLLAERNQKKTAVTSGLQRSGRAMRFVSHRSDEPMWNRQASKQEGGSDVQQCT
jgi:hypothetical protein